MEKENNSLWMVISILEVTRKVSQMALGNTLGLMEVIIKVNSKTVWGKAKENGFITMELFMKVSLKAILNKVMASKPINPGSTLKVHLLRELEAKVRCMMRVEMRSISHNLIDLSYLLVLSYYSYKFYDQILLLLWIKYKYKSM